LITLHDNTPQTAAEWREQKAIISHHQAMVAFKSAQYTQAVTYYLKAYEEYRDIQDVSQMVNCLKGLIVSFAKINDSANQKKYQQELTRIKWKYLSCFNSDENLIQKIEQEARVKIGNQYICLFRL
jgi:hypothetical protein